MLFCPCGWLTTQVALGLSKPYSVPQMFESFLMDIPKEINPLVLLGVAISCWLLWLNKNDVVFQRKISLAGCLYNYPLAPYKGHSSRSGFYRILVWQLHVVSEDRQ